MFVAWGLLRVLTLHSYNGFWACNIPRVNAISADCGTSCTRSSARAALSMASAAKFSCSIIIVDIETAVAPSKHNKTNPANIFATLRHSNRKDSIVIFLSCLSFFLFAPHSFIRKGEELGLTTKPSREKTLIQFCFCRSAVFGGA